MKTTATVAELEKALENVNKRYAGNVDFDRLESNGGKWCNFTLRVKSSKGIGARRGFTGRRLAKACWHAHGHFFEELLALNPEAVILTRGGPGARIDKHVGNWQDSNIGSMMQPLYFSEACDCEKGQA